MPNRGKCRDFHAPEMVCRLLLPTGMKTLLDPLEVDSPAIEWFDRSSLKAAIAEASEGPPRRWAPHESWRPSRLWASEDDFEPLSLPRLADDALL